jgi:hypothetical protein
MLLTIRASIPRPDRPLRPARNFRKRRTHGRSPRSGIKRPRITRHRITRHRITRLRIIPPAAGRNQAGDGEPRYQGAEGLRQSSRRARLDRALSDGRGSARHRGEFQYGRHGTPTTKALQATLMALEGPQCAGAGLAPSGLAAISTTLLAVLKAGDHLLVCDNVYRPTRSFCDGLLTRFDVQVSYHDPLIGAGIDSLFKPNTRAVLIEAPGSQSLEMPDLPAIASVAHRHGALVIDDNTWATPLYHRSLELGVASGARNRSRTRDLETRFQRRLGPVQHRAEAETASCRRCAAGRPRLVRHGLFLGRLRKPGDSVRLRGLSNRDPMGAGETGGTASSDSRMSTISRPTWNAASLSSTPRDSGNDRGALAPDLQGHPGTKRLIRRRLAIA